MNTSDILPKLPTEAPGHVRVCAYHSHLDELGGHLGIYKRVSYQMMPELSRCMDFDDWAPTKSVWAAEVCCTACTEYWHTAWVGGPMKAIRIVVGEDGLHYPVTNLDDPDVAPDVVELTHNDGILCPYCGENITLTHVSRIKSGITRRLAICSVETVDNYGALVYWMVYRHIDSDGCVYTEVSPWYAFILDEAGKLTCFRYASSGWSLSRNREDPFWKMYQSGDGGIYNLKRGGFVCDVVPDLTGTTAEKTGLAAYIKQGGCLPLMYLRIWKLHPSIENLVMQEWTPLIESIFNRHINWQSAATPNLPSMSEINWDSAKPHEMLGMDKVGYRSLDKPSNDRRRYEWFDSWRSYKSQGGGCNVAEFDKFYCTFTRYGAETAIDLMGQLPGLDLPKLEKYLTKQGIEPHEVRLLSDAWRMTYVLTGREALTHEERWPKALRQRHDQLTEMYQATATDPIEQARFADGFRRIYDKYAPLQWSDGELDIILPRDNGELVREGTVLRHCVGTYGKAHVNETSTIFFVRRHRRRERCYYTLAMNMSGIPKRSQLHGYGNEHHGDNKQYSHSIPKKVLDFCQRWEENVVMPWYKEQIGREQGKEAAAV